MPEGDAMYAFFVRKYTTTNVTPREVHEKGLSEVKRIRAAMQEVMNQVGFKGTVPEFFTFLRTDKRFYYTTPEELFAAYQALAKRIDPNLVKVFQELYRACLMAWNRSRRRSRRTQPPLTTGSRPPTARAPAPIS